MFPLFSSHPSLHLFPCCGTTQGFSKVCFKGTPRNCLRPLFFSNMFKIIPKPIFYYSIGSRSALLVLLYLQKFQHKIYDFNSIKHFVVHQ